MPQNAIFAGGPASFRSLIENSLDVITVLDAQGTILYESPAVRTVLGYDPDEIIGRNAFEFVHPDDHSGTILEFTRVMQGATIHPFEFRFRHHDGHWCPLEAVGSAVTFDSPLILNPCVVVHSRDITVRQHAEQSLRESEARKSAILETSLDCIITIDAQSRVLEWNPAAERTFGYTHAEVEGQLLQDLIVPPELRSAHQNGMTRYLDTGVGPVIGQRLELPAICRDGNRITIELAIVPIPGCDPPMFTGHLRDITARLETQRALEAAKADAEAARETAERASRTKSEFLSRVSHELRTPLNAVLGFAQLLKMDDITSDQMEMVSDIHNAGKHLLDLINEVLDISRIEEGHLSLTLEPVSVSVAVADALSLIAPLAAQRGLRVLNTVHADEHYVQADRRRLNQVLVNLLSNGVKYNREAGELTISCERSSTASTTGSEAQLRVKIADTGIGIAPERRGELFEPFARLGAERTEVEGTGLGLALTKRLIEAMGGQIGVFSVPGEGSTFWFDFPRAEEPGEFREDAEQDAASPTPPQESQRITLLYVEDDPINFKVVERALARRSAFRLLHAPNGTTGLDLARRENPALILLDVHLPDFNGDEVLRQLRADARTSSVPVIMLSADAMSDQIERMMKEGADDYLTKPLDINQLFSTLGVWLDEKGEQHHGRERRQR